METPKNHKLLIRLPKEVACEFKSICALQKSSQTKIILGLVEKYIQDYKEFLNKGK